MEKLKIYVDRLKHEESHKIAESLPPDFLDIEEEELIFDEPVLIKGEAYVADDHLVANLHIETSATLPCSICNDAVDKKISIKNHYITISLSEIPSAVYDLANDVRETILLQTPLFAECNEGKCPERESVKKFFKQTEGQNAQFPFADLDGK